MPNQRFTGSCHCKAVRYRASGPAANQCVCHCESCRQAAGAPFVAWVTFPVGEFKIVSGSLCEYQSSPRVTRGHCARCGTTLTYFHEGRSGDIDVSLTTLDEACKVEPAAHIWTEDQLSWVVIGDDLPVYRQYRTSG